MGLCFCSLGSAGLRRARARELPRSWVSRTGNAQLTPSSSAGSSSGGGSSGSSSSSSSGRDSAGSLQATSFIPYTSLPHSPE